MAGLYWSDNPNYCYKYNTLCQPCSSLWLNIVLLFKFGWLNLLQDPTFNQTGSLFKALQFVIYLELTTSNRHRVKFRFKLCSPYLFCLFLKCIWHEKFFLLIWKAFQNTEEWRFSFWNIFFSFRDIDVFLLCKLDQWWRHIVCNWKW